MTPRYAVSLAIALGLTTSLIFGQKIPDISTTDPSYPMAINAVKYGYLILSQDGQFKPDAAVSRKELSVIIDKLLAGDASTDLTKPQIQELLGLSKSFKTQVTTLETTQQMVETEQVRLSDEQKATHKDISALQAKLTSANIEINQLKSQVAALDPTQREKADRDEKTAMWVSIAVALLFGIFK